MIKELVTKSSPVAVYHKVMTEFNDDSFTLNCGQILMGERGTYTLYINYVPVTLCPGRIIVMNPGNVVSTEGARPDFQCSCLAYDADVLQEALSGMSHLADDFSSDHFASHAPGLFSFAHRLLHIVEPLIAEVSTDCIRQVAAMQVRTFFLVCQDRKDKETDAHSRGNRRKEQLFTTFFHHLTTHYRQARTASFYAKTMNMTPRYLNDIVNHTTGKSTKTIIDDYVMMQLKQALQANDTTVKEVAWQFGFDSMPFFNDYFKRHARITPQAYRELL